VSAPLRIVYVAGNGRSGSTLLDRMLGQMPGAISLGEVRFLYEFGLQEEHLCECGAVVRACPFWGPVVHAALGPVSPERARELARQSRRLLWTPALPRLLGWPTGAAFRRLCDEHAAAAGRLYRAIAERSGATWLVDSSKLAAYAFLLARVPGLELHVVHLVRDSRAVAFSWQRTRVKPEVAARRALMPVRPPLLTALRWNGHNLLARALARAAKSHVRVRYEDLVRAPARTLANVADALGMERSELGFVGDGAVELRRGHSVAGNPSRFQSGRVPLRLDEEWRRAMPRANRALVTLLTLPQLLAYGYGARTRPTDLSGGAAREEGVAHG